MGAISSELIKLDPTLKIISEESNKLYDSFNDAGVECEVGELLYSFIRVLKPTRVLETGTHWGIGAAYIGLALRDNGSGRLDTYEFLPEIHAVADKRIKTMGLENFVKCNLADVTTLDLGANQYQFIFLDTEPQLRFNEFIRFWDNLEDGGYLFIHDLHRHMHQIENKEHGFAWPFGLVPAFINALIDSGAVRLFHFPTPRGITGFYKVHHEDYKKKNL